MSCLRAAHTTASIGVLTSSRSQMDRSRRRRVRALSSSLRAATSAVTPLAICASSRISSSLSRRSSVPRRASVACSTPSSLVRGDDRGDAAVRYTGTGRPRSVALVAASGPSGLRSSFPLPKRVLGRRWPMGRLTGATGELQVTMHTLANRTRTHLRVPRPLPRRRGRPRWGGGVLSETGPDRQPSQPAPSRSVVRLISVPAVDEDRESFQATLRLGTLGGRIRPVKRPFITICTRIDAHRGRPYGGVPRKTR